MTENNSPTSSYTMGYSEEFQQLLNRRSARSHAFYLLPHLKPGQKLLDFGCGPGTITMGLARAVEPGEIHGIDAEASQIELAQAAAQAGGHANATFHVGNVTDMPFEDNTFDVAHCHAVLMHVPDTSAVLSEVKRVLKPGGLIAARESIIDSCFLEPSPSDLASAWDTFGRLLAGNGGHPRMGKELKNLLVEAGFTDVRPSASFEFFGSKDDILFFHGFVRDWFFMPQVIEAATKYGLATQGQFDEWREGLDMWRDHPGAVGGIAFGEALGSKS